VPLRVNMNLNISLLMKNDFEMKAKIGFLLSCPKKLVTGFNLAASVV
jgi:protein-arginine kinase